MTRHPLVYSSLVEKVGYLVLLVGDEVGVCLEDDGLGVADPSRDGAVAHTFGQ